MDRPKDRMADISLLSDILPDLLDDAIGARASEGLRAMHVVETWRRVLGVTMGRYCTGERFEAGTLFVNVRSAALRQELFMNKAAVVKKINAELGVDIVKTLVVR